MYFISELRSNGATVTAVISEFPDGFSECDGKDGNLRFTVGAEFWHKLGFCEGAKLTEEDFSKIENAAKKSEAVSKALNVLARSNHSKVSLLKKLRFKYGIDAEYAEFAAEYCIRRGYIDEAGQAEKFARNSACSKLWGKERIVSELLVKGYPREVAVSAARSIGNAEYGKNLKKAILKKTKEPPADYAEKAKLTSSLARLGYGLNEIEKATADLFGE